MIITPFFSTKDIYICRSNNFALFMQDNGSVEHKGVVEEVNSDQIRVGFISHSACSSCYAKGACSLSELENKYVEVRNEGSGFKVGDNVDILLQQRQGFKALWLGYVLPFILMVAILIIVMAVTEREGVAGISGVSVLIPYYLGLYFFRDKVKEKFDFKIRKTV
jgi:sigma-E factor negative regulatory protein RseC